MGKKWDGKTLKQSHITHINKYIKWYCSERWPLEITQKSLHHLWLCSKCEKFKHQHTYPAFRYRYSWLCVETYSSVKEIIDKAKDRYGVEDFLFCDNSSSTRSFTRMFTKNEELSLLVEAYVKLTHRVESNS